MPYQRLTSAASTIAIAVLAAACGGGGDDSGAGPEPEPQQPLQAAYVGHGDTARDPTRDPASRVVRSSDEFAALPPALEGRLPAGFAQPDYANKALLFLEYLSIRNDEWGASAVGIEKIESNEAGTAHVVSAEFCRYPAGHTTGPVTDSRAYGLFETRAFTGAVDFQWTVRKHPDCQAVPHPVVEPDPIPADYEGWGTVSVDAPVEDPPLLLFRNHDEFTAAVDLLLPYYFNTPLPVYDYAKVNVIYVQGKTGNRQSYVRLQSMRSTPDGSRHEIEVESCGVPAQPGESMIYPMGIYMIAPLSGEVIFNLNERTPPDCITASPYPEWY